MICDGTAVAQWLTCCATNRKVAGSIPAGVSGFFIDIKSFRCTMALESTQPLTEVSTRSISWGKGGQCVRLTTLPPSCAVVMKSGNLNFPQPSRPLQAYAGTTLLIRSVTFRSSVQQTLTIAQMRDGVRPAQIIYIRPVTRKWKKV